MSAARIEICILAREMVWLPVYPMKGRDANSDCSHAGEMTFCGAIEMSGILTLKIHSLIKGGVDKFGMTMPMFRPSPVDPVYNDQLIFEGISVDLHGYDNGRQYDLDATAAYKQAALNAIAYLQKLGCTSRFHAVCALTLNCSHRHTRASVYPSHRRTDRISYRGARRQAKRSRHSRRAATHLRL